jgi:hypothetical protein
MNALDKQYDTYLMDEFDKTLKLLHESTHDEKIRESILLVQRYKTEYLDNKKQR